MKSGSILLLRWLNGIAFAAVLAVNALANLLPISGITTGQVSDIFPSLFTPAPHHFRDLGGRFTCLQPVSSSFKQGLSTGNAAGNWFGKRAGCSL